MRNLLALVGLAVVVFAGLGWYLGWYSFQSETTSPGHRQIKIDVNTDKISKDVHKGEQKLHDALEHNSAPTSTQVSPAQSPPTNPPGSSVTVNDDGSVSYRGNFKFPALVPGQNNPNP